MKRPNSSSESNLTTKKMNESRGLSDMSDDEISNLKKTDFQVILKPALLKAFEGDDITELGNKLDSLDGKTYLLLCSQKEDNTINKLMNIYGIAGPLADKIYAHLIAPRNTNQSKGHKHTLEDQQESSTKRAKTEANLIEEAQSYLKWLIPNLPDLKLKTISLNGIVVTTDQKSANPSLLLDRLPGLSENPLKIGFSERFSNFKERVGILAEISGAGKTRSTIEELAEKWGIYFPVSRMGNGGSQDFESMTTTLESQLQTGGSQKERVNEPNQFVNNKTATKHLTTIFLERLVILDYFLDLKPDLTPAEWLVSQLYPMNYFPRDVFLEVYNQLRFLDPETIQDRVQEFTNKRPQLRDLLVFVDEAQMLLGIHKDLYKSTKYGKPRSLFSRVAGGFYGAKKTFLVGAAKEMLSVFDTPTAIGKMIDYDLGKNWFYYWDANVAWDRYVGHYLGADLKDEFIKDYFPLIQGRARFLSTFINYWLQSNDFANAYEQTRELYTGLGNASITTAFLNTNLIEGIEIADNISRYIFQGVPFEFNNDTSSKLLNYGICQMDQGQPKEPLVIQAMIRCFFEGRLDELYILPKLLKEDNGSVAGFAFEKVMALILYKQLLLAEEQNRSILTCLGVKGVSLSDFWTKPFQIAKKVDQGVPLLGTQTWQTYLDDQECVINSHPTEKKADLELKVIIENQLVIIKVQLKLLGLETHLNVKVQEFLEDACDTTALSAEQRIHNGNLIRVIRLLILISYSCREAGKVELKYPWKNLQPLPSAVFDGDDVILYAGYEALENQTAPFLEPIRHELKSLKFSADHFEAKKEKRKEQRNSSKTKKEQQGKKQQGKK